MKSLASVPRVISDEIGTFCLQIEGNGTPFFVSVKPYHASKYGDCFENVKRYVHEHFGSIVYGWNIWQTGKYLLHAEFHAIHQSDTGVFLDVTPYLKPAARTLFLPSSLSYAQKRVPSHYFPLLEDCRIIDFVSALENLAVIEEICSNSDAKLYFDLPENTLHLQQMQEGMKEIEVKIELFEKMVLNGIGRNDLCFCRSGEKFKRCCGR